MSNHHASNAEKNYLSGGLCHPVLDLCLHFAFALCKQGKTLLLSSLNLEGRVCLRGVHCIFYVFFLSGWDMFRAWLERAPECGLLSPILPLLVSTGTDIVATKVSSWLLRSHTWKCMRCLGESTCRSITKSDRCHCFTCVLCFQGFHVFFCGLFPPPLLKVKTKSWMHWGTVWAFPSVFLVSLSLHLL